MTLVEIVGNQYIRNLMLEAQVQELAGKVNQLEAQLQDHEAYGPTKIAEALMAQNMLDVACVNAAPVIAAALKTPGHPTFGDRTEAQANEALTKQQLEAGA